jgi:hypothetical protein
MKRKTRANLPALAGVAVFLAAVAACGTPAKPPASHSTTVASVASSSAAPTPTPTSVAARAQVAANSVDALEPLQQAVNSCLQSIIANANNLTIESALDKLLPNSGDVYDAAQIANDSLEITYKTNTGQLSNATFDAGRVIFAVISHAGGEFAVFGIIGDPALDCVQAAFWYTGQLGGQIGQLLRAKLQPASAATASIEGTWTLTRAAATTCVNFPAGCHDSPIPVKFSNCTDTRCLMSRTDGVWQSTHGITRSGSTWVADFSDIGIACGSQVHVGEIIIQLSVTSTQTVNGVLTAKSLGGHYAVNGPPSLPGCKATDNAHALEAMYGTR